MRKATVPRTRGGSVQGATMGGAPREAVPADVAFDAHDARESRAACGCYDVAVIGGGASGLSAAIAAARSGARTVVLERDVACGLPILATGNGRCNVGNARLDPARYRDAAAARAVMGPSPEAELSSFFDSLGLMTCEIEGRLYPVTRRAATVRDVLLAACARAGAELRTGCDLERASHDDVGGLWLLEAIAPTRPPRVEADAQGRLDLRRARRALSAAPCGRATIAARRVILAPGGRSQHLCDLLGLPHGEEVPVLCPIACELDPPTVPPAGLEDLDGLRVEAAVSLIRHGDIAYHEEGEVLFRPYGISGIAAFDLSRRVEPGDVLELDLFPGFDAGALIGRLRAREDAIGPFTGADVAWLDGVLARPLARVVLAMTAADVRPLADGLRGDALTRLALLLKSLPLRVQGLAEQGQAQVRRGGVPLEAVDLATLAVKPPAAPALHVCGEALDQDADCGGYNLAWAWLSGSRAGRAAARAATGAVSADAAGGSGTAEEDARAEAAVGASAIFSEEPRP